MSFLFDYASATFRFLECLRGNALAAPSFTPRFLGLAKLMYALSLGILLPVALTACATIHAIQSANAHPHAQSYSIPFEANYVYVIHVASPKRPSIFIGEKQNGALRKIPQTVLLKNGSFSIVCDIQMKEISALANPKGVIKFSKDGVPEIDGKIGKPLSASGAWN